VHDADVHALHLHTHIMHANTLCYTSCLQAQEAAATAGAPVPSEASEALAAADSLLGILRAASDGRSVKAVAPEADAGQLLTGDKTQRSQVSLDECTAAVVSPMRAPAC
jgi:hypothetical protein